MDQEKGLPKGLLFNLIWASAGLYKHFRFTVWGQLIFGFLYSFGFFDIKIAGLILGFLMPTFWIILTYKFLLYKSKENPMVLFPGWMQKNPGNIIIIIIDIVFLGAIWYLILSGIYDPVWIKVVFTMVLPILTLSMLRNLLHYSFSDDDDQYQRDNN
jgi:hypothetical protein